MATPPPDPMIHPIAPSSPVPEALHAALRASPGALVLLGDGAVVAANGTARTLLGAPPAGPLPAPLGAEFERLARLPDLGDGHHHIAYAGRQHHVTLRRCDRPCDAYVIADVDQGPDEERFRALFEATFEGVLIHERGVILEANQRAADLTGYSVEELVGMSVFNIAAPDTVTDEERAAATTEEPPEGFFSKHEIVGQGKGGERAAIEVITRSFMYGGRRVFVSSFRDITAHRATEAALKDLAAWQALVAEISANFISVPTEAIPRAIEDALARLACHQGAVRAYVCLFDEDMAHISGAHEWRREGVPSVKEKMQHVPVGGMPLWWGQLQQRAVIRVSRPEELPADAHAERAMLEKLGLRSVAGVPMETQGRLLGFVGFDWQETHEITDDLARQLRLVGDILAGAVSRQRYEEALEAARTDLEDKVEARTRALRAKHAQLLQSEKLASLGQLVAGVAHEINTPLGAIKSNHDVLAKAVAKLGAMMGDCSGASDGPDAIGPLGSKARRLIDTIGKVQTVDGDAIHRIVAIVKSLKKFARLDEAEVDTIDVHQGLDATLTLVRHELKHRIEVHRDYGKLPAVECYPNQLNQVFMNILVNAAQAIEGKGDIWIRTRPADGGVVVEFQDTGRGIPEDHLKRVFDPGFTTKGAGIGTGLGLSIVHQIVEDHGGEITVESAVGQGTTFRVRLHHELPRHRSRMPPPPDA